ncbi:hypothetical protein [Streptomyces sp. NPDC002994]|uniref:hypothetical protein n=1 Tax=Streptomyces sp. NPDC002994 TaxID=3154441 RepID=UPI0033A7FB35
MTDEVLELLRVPASRARPANSGLPLGVLALRGCPMCWTIGLMQTISRGRLRRSCEDGQCELERGGRE